MAGHAVDDDALAAELGPADTAVLAAPAALVVMDHHALTGRRVGLADAGAPRGNHAARLVAGDDRSALAAQAERRRRVADGAVGMQIAPAHPRGLHGDDHFAGPRRRVGEFTQLELPATEENYATHDGLLCGYPITNSRVANRGGAAMQTTKLGEVTISRVIEIDRSSFPTASMLPGSSAEVIAGHHRWLKPYFFDERTGDLASRIQTYVVRTPHHTILIDTGVGNDKARTLAPAWNMRSGTYLDDLAAVGVTPEQVDFVVCTHLHVDHVGWNTRWQDGRWVPTFPNAQVRDRRSRVGVLEVRERIRQGGIGVHRRQRRAGGRGGPGAARRERLQDRRAPALRAVGRPYAGPCVRAPHDVGGQRDLLRGSHAPHGAGRRAPVVEPLLLRPGPGTHHASRVRRAPRGFGHA